MHKMITLDVSAITYSEKIQFCAANRSAASFADYRLHLHLIAARLQMDRIGQAIRASHSVRPEPSAGATQEQLRAYVRGDRTPNWKR